MSGKLTDIGGNPTGAIGRLAGRLMNGLSTRFYRSMIETRLRDLLSAGRRLTVLDIGCGGGVVVGVFHSLIPDGRVCGIDHSPDMAALSRRKNRRAVRDGAVSIDEGDVAALPYPDAYFDIATAFDTLSFWVDQQAALEEVGRVLAPGGRLLVINGCPKEGSKWWRFVRLKTEEDYRTLLERSGFAAVKTEIVAKRIVVTSEKGQGA